MKYSTIDGHNEGVFFAKKLSNFMAKSHVEGLWEKSNETKGYSDNIVLHSVSQSLLREPLVVRQICSSGPRTAIQVNILCFAEHQELFSAHMKYSRTLLFQVMTIYGLKKPRITRENCYF